MGRKWHGDPPTGGDAYVIVVRALRAQLRPNMDARVLTARADAADPNRQPAMDAAYRRADRWRRRCRGPIAPIERTAAGMPSHGQQTAKEAQ
jgi:hypothetical protein